MWVSKTAASGFRNLHEFELNLTPTINVAHGVNGAGKTNLVDAIFLSLTGRSCRGLSDRELIPFDHRHFYLQTTVLATGEEHLFEVGFERGGQKSLKFDGSPRLRFGPELSRPLVLAFNPDRLELVKGPPGVRRAHVDQLVQALWPARRATRRQYMKALAQRNALLSAARSSSAGEQLDAWTRELAVHAVELVSQREEAISLLEKLYAAKSQALGSPPPQSLIYKSSLKGLQAEDFVARLAERLQNDIDRGFTGAGPHRDDLVFTAGEHNLRSFGSQGEQRTAVLALLLAEREVISDLRGDSSLLLLDDVMSELDASRRRLLLSELDRGGQCLLTTADPAELAEHKGANLIEVVNGSVRGAAA